jgi:predicted double-glycine peptidase
MTLDCKNIWLKKGSKGTLVKTLQEDLNNKGISKLKLNGGALATDGDFGSVTEKVVRYAQEKALHVSIDGIVGPETCKALNNYSVTSGNGWTRIQYTRDSQDTNYTCGPSSLKMALSVYGLYYSEGTLATLVKAKAGVGTENANLVNAVNNLGKGLKAWNESFQSWERLQGYLSKGWPVILRIASYWTAGNEHFVLLAGLNISGGKVELGDPSNGGYRATTTTDLRERIRKVASASIIVIMK